MINNQREPLSSHFEEEPNLSPTELLQLAEPIFVSANFHFATNMPLNPKSQQPNDPNYAINSHYALQLLTISNILSNPTNYYSILQVSPFCNDFTLIRSQFTLMLSVIEPIKDKFSVGKEALNLFLKAYGCLSDPTKKTQFDSQFGGHRSETENEGFDGGTFWTFCPYCFYMYEYARVHEECCLKCQNQTCRRGFHGAAVNSLPRMDLDKGVYFSCFGCFPLGFSPESGGKEKSSGKFEYWSPIVGMFPVKRIGKTSAGRMNLNGADYDWFNNGDFVEILDESDDESGNDQGVKVGSFGGVNVGNAPSKRRKSVPWNSRKLMSRGKKSNDGVGVNGSGGYGEEDGYEFEDGFEVGNGGLGGGSCVGLMTCHSMRRTVRFLLVLSLMMHSDVWMECEN